MLRRHFLALSAALPLPLAAQPAPQTIRVVTRQIDVKGRAARVYGLIGAGGQPGWTGRQGYRI